MTEAELAWDLHSLLAKVRQGVEVVIEEDSEPVAVLKAPQVKDRRISEVIAALEASGSNAVIDEDFARDVEAGIDAHREPCNPVLGVVLDSSVLVAAERAKLKTPEAIRAIRAASRGWLLS